MKYSEAKKQIEQLSSKYSIDMDKFSRYFNINYKGVEIAFVNSDSEYGVGVWNSKIFYKLPFSNKLYMILSELAVTPLDERAEEKKYYVKIGDSIYSYLNINTITNKMLMMVGSTCETNFIKTEFTNKEIEQLKQREDIPLDWEKVHFEGAE